MPLFSFTPIVPKPTVKKQYVKKEDKIIGIVNIDINGNYYLVADKNYNFTEDSFNTKNVQTVYTKFIDKHSKSRIKLVRNNDYMPALTTRLYSPFGVGCIVECILVNSCKVKFIKIKESFNENDSKDAIDFLIKNYKTIYANINSKD